MKHLFGYYRGHIGSVAAILLLTIVLVWCDLALPQYTSDIVDVGIQQGGIEDAVPDYISQESFDNLGLFMKDKDIETAKSFYEEGKDGVLEYVGTDEDRQTVSDLLTTPMVALFMAGQSDEFDIDQLKMAIEYGMVSKDEMLDGMKKQMDQYMGESGLSDSLLNQAGIAFIRTEYEKVGVDMDKLQMKYLWREGFEMLAITLFMILTSIAVGFFAARTGARIGRDARKAMFKKVMGFSHTEMDKFSTASLITRSTNDIQHIQMTCTIVLRVSLMAPIMGIGACIKIAATRTGLAWTAIAAVATIAVVVVFLMVFVMPKFKIMQKLVDRLNLVSREIISGIPVIRAFSRSKHEEGRFDAASRDLMSTQLFTQRAMACMMPALMIIMNGLVIAIMWFGGKGIDVGRLQVGDMMAFINYAMMIVMSFMMLTIAAIMIPRAGVAAERVHEVMITETSIHDAAETKKLEDVKGVVEFDHVHFRYSGAPDDVLEDITFKAEPGKTTAIIGSTGSGKTTLINLIPRFYDVTEGKITVDGVDIREMTQHDLRALIGYVPQKGVLFSGDIRSNIKFASADITDETMVEAAEVAQAIEFIDAKEDKYDTHIAQGGTNVSGGQKQRLSIARAVAKDPKIYIFDDSFSALDYKTDAKLRKELFEKTGDAAVIIVAQRIATILHADKILVLEEGKIVGEGTHEELLKTCQTYYEIASSQLSEEELGKGAL